MSYQGKCDTHGPQYDWPCPECPKEPARLHSNTDRPWSDVSDIEIREQRLIEEVRRLKEENDGLRESLAEWTGDFKSLEAENRALSDQVRSLTDALERVEKSADGPEAWDIARLALKPCSLPDAKPSDDSAEAWMRTAERYRAALESISKNGCCDTCQEAKLVALAALSNPTMPQDKLGMVERSHAASERVDGAD